MNKNIMIGGGVIALGIFLTFRAKKKGKVVPFVGKLIPSSSSSDEMSNYVGHNTPRGEKTGLSSRNYNNIGGEPQKTSGRRRTMFK